MSSQSIKRPRVHQREQGTERCGHLCEGRNCVNSTGSLDWNKEGSAIPRHKKSKKRHPQCNEDCPLHNKLQRSTRVTSSQSRASQSSSRALSVPAGTSEASSSLGGFDMDVDLEEEPQGIMLDNGWYLFPLSGGLLIYPFPSLDNQPSTRVYKILIVLEPSRHKPAPRSEEHTSELQSHLNLVCRLLLEKKKKKKKKMINNKKNR